MLKPYQKKIIELMIRQESLLAKLYMLFTIQFPEHGKVWDELAKEEKKHANWLNQLYDAGEKSIILFDEGKTKTHTMNAYIKHLEQVITKVENREVTLHQAISYTLDFESSLIEKNVFTRFDSTSEQTRSVLKRLAHETESHIKRIQALRS